MKKAGLIMFIMLAVGLQGATLFVLNSGSETISSLNTGNGEVDNTFAVLGSMPNRLVCAEDFIYVVNSGDNNVQKIDIEDGTSISTIFLGTTVNPYDLILVGDFLYVSGGLSNTVYKIDTSTDAVAGELAVGSNPAGLAVLNDKLYVGNTDYMGSYANCSVSVIDLLEFEVISTIPTNANPQYLLAIENNIHVSCGGNWSNEMGSIQIVEGNSDTIIHTINMGGNCGDLAVLGNGNVYVGDAMNTAVYAYNAQSWEEVYSPAVPFVPGGSVVESDENHLAVLGGQWGENFTVYLYNQAEEHLANYQVALYGTDMKFKPEETCNDEDMLQTAIITAYPNPFISGISFRVKNSRAEIENIKIYDLKGRLIQNYCGSSAINAVELAAGIYISRINLSNGKQEIKKVIKLK